MIQITLSEEQTRQLREAEQTVQFIDADGRPITTLPHGWTEQDIAEARQAATSGSRRWSTDEVMQHLKTLGSAS